MREEYSITKGRIVARGGVCKRNTPLFADYILFYKPHIPLAVVEAKDNNHAVGAGIQQALEYAERMMIPFVFSSNGDGFVQEEYELRMAARGDASQGFSAEAMKDINDLFGDDDND
jgi:type I restriction enzyme R subunit